MGRKPITPSQRSIPVSFSVKPVLADRIEQMAYDQRFTRSRFLSEAVLRYINFIEMGGLEGSENVTDMTLGRRVLIGANALQEANRENEPLPKNIIEFLKSQLSIYETKNLIRKIDAKEAKKAVADTRPAKITFENIGASRHLIKNNGTAIGQIEKFQKRWIVRDSEAISQSFTFKTLKSAKQEVKDFYQGAV